MMPSIGFVLTVIGGPGSSLDDQTVIGPLRAALAEAGASPGPTRWLDPGIACDIPIAGADPAAAEAAVRARLEGCPVDLAVQVEAGRRKRLLLADMESTIIGQEMLDELAEVAGLGTRITEITARAMAGDMEFDAALKRRVALLKGLPAGILDQVAARMTLNPGARTLVQTMRAAGAHTVLVSGGFTCFTDRVRDDCGFDEARGNRLIVAEGRLTGAVAEPILGPDAKRRTLEEMVKMFALSPAMVCATGDGANDVAMLRAAGLGVAYRAKPVLRAATRIQIDHGALTALLYLQGYRRAEFRT